MGDVVQIFHNQDEIYDRSDEIESIVDQEETKELLQLGIAEY